MNFTCEYCQQAFVKKSTRDTHYCSKMQKKDFLETTVGKISFIYYKEWLKLNKGSAYVTIDTFLNSRYFSSFIKFLHFSNKMLLPDRISFMKYMISLNILPSHWCVDAIYINYIENLDKIFTPIQQAEETIRTLHELASIFNCKLVEVFVYLLAGDCIRLLKARKLTPWIMLFSKKFHNYLITNLSAEQRAIITETVINPTLWKNKFQNNMEEVKKMKKIVQDLGL